MKSRCGKLHFYLESSTKSNRNKEVYVSIAYNSKMAMEQAKKAIRQDLEEKGNKLHEQLDKILGF